MTEGSKKKGEINKLCGSNDSAGSLEDTDADDVQMVCEGRVLCKRSILEYSKGNDLFYNNPNSCAPRYCISALNKSSILNLF